MEPLESYFLTEYRDIRQKIELIEKIIPEVIQVYVDFFFDEEEVNIEEEKEGQWPYEVPDCRIKQKDGKPKLVEKPPSYSTSTNSMIIFTLAVVSGLIQESPLVPKIRIPIYPKGEDALKVLRKVLSKAFKKLAKHKPDIKKIPFEEDMITFSWTFGFNDPFTLSWFLELTNVIPDILDKLQIPNPREKLLKEAKKLINKVAEAPDKPILNWRGERTLPQQPEHVFPLLKVVQLFHILKQINSEPEIDVELIHRYFNHCIHQHLSYSSIPDIGFDAAELMFSLEGSFLCKPEAFNEIILNRVFEILNKRQEQSPYWQPTKPFVATAQGEVLMPLSVEIANSLLRICRYLEKDRLSDSYFSMNIELFKRYEDWLRSRMVKGIAISSSKEKPGKKNFIGWQSEYIPRPGIIDLWETSQVLLFLAYYAAMLQRHITRTSLYRANLSVKRPEPSYDDFRCHDPLIKKWDCAEEIYEPLKGFEDKSEYRLYGRIAEHYIAPRAPHATNQSPSKDIHYSMLLFGPPGSAKTTVAQELSNALGFPLIYITPSDFIAGGEAEVERRTKAIFQMLQEQNDVIILFDEIDRMILDRESNLYLWQSDVFQFMTPGMLTKLKDLRDKKQTIFIVATNYAERIDKAAKRKGRIDDQFLVLPPDAQQRFNILKHLIEKYIKGPSVPDEALRGKLNETISNTALFIFDELKQLVLDAIPIIGNREDSSWFEKLQSALLERIPKVEPTITLTSYRDRFRITSGKPKKEFPTIQEPFEEFLLLIKLMLEVNSKVQSKDEDVVKRVVLEGKQPPVKKEDILKKVLTHVRDDSVKDFLLKKFVSFGWCE